MIKDDGHRLTYVNKENLEIAQITYTNAGESLYIIDQTLVEESYQGKGFAKKLVQALVEKARNEGKKVVPLCPFANAEFERRMEYSDVRK